MPMDSITAQAPDDDLDALDPAVEALAAAYAAAEAERDDDGETFGPVAIAPARQALPEAEGMRVQSLGQRAKVEEAATPAPEPVAQPETPPPAQEVATDTPPAAPDPDAAIFDAIPEAHRDRFRGAMEHSKLFQPIAEFAVARGLTVAETPAAVGRLVELNDMANADPVGYVAHITPLLGMQTDEAKAGFVAAIAEKLGAPAPAAEPAPEEDDLYADPKVKALEATVAEMRAMIAKIGQPAAAAPQAPPAPPAEAVNAITSFASERDPATGAALRPYWGALTQGGHIAAAITEKLAAQGNAPIAPTAENLAAIYTAALKRAGIAAPASPPKPPAAPRGLGASRVLDASQGALKDARPMGGPREMTQAEEIEALAAVFRDSRA